MVANAQQACALNTSTHLSKSSAILGSKIAAIFSNFARTRWYKLTETDVVSTGRHVLSLENEVPLLPQEYVTSHHRVAGSRPVGCK
jgi:hypothetical protein